MQTIKFIYISVYTDCEPIKFEIFLILSFYVKIRIKFCGVDTLINAFIPLISLQWTRLRYKGKEQESKQIQRKQEEFVDYCFENKILSKIWFHSYLRQFYLRNLVCTSHLLQGNVHQGLLIFSSSIFKRNHFLKIIFQQIQTNIFQQILQIFI
ncbi:hypothetical protein pb186bvf_013468 [Paramecium bursaria]